MNHPPGPVKCMVIPGLFLCLVPACTQLISDEFPEFEPVPVVNSILVAGRPITFHVSLAEKIDSTSLTLVDNAVLTLSEGAGGSEVLTPVGDGFYSSGRIAMPGEIYSCLIHLDGYEDLYACDTVPEKTEVKITGQTNRARQNEEGIFMEGIELEFCDDPGTRDYYEVVLYRRKYRFTSQSYLFNENSEILLNEGLEPYSTETLVFSDELMEDSLVHLKLDFGYDWNRACWNDSCVQVVYEHTLILELRHVSREYYRYKKQFYLYEESRYPFFVEGTATAISIYSNVVNGMGIVAGYACSMDSLFVEEERIPLSR